MIFFQIDLSVKKLIYIYKQIIISKRLGKLTVAKVEYIPSQTMPIVKS